MKLSKSAVIASLIALAATQAAMAGVVTSAAGITDGVNVTMPIEEYQGLGPIAFGPGNSITWSSNYTSSIGDDSVFGWNEDYGFGTNGPWNYNVTDGPIVMAALNTTGGNYAMTFDFADPVSGFGGFMNYSPNWGTAVFSAYDSSDTLIETYDLTFSTGGAFNSGQFVGFQDSSNDISYVTLSNAFVGIADIVESSTSSSVPDTASTALLLGFASLALIAGAKRQAKSV
jgi:hypothetical protein